MTTHTSFPSDAHGRRMTLATLVVIAAIALTTGACRNTTSDEKAEAPAAPPEATAPSGPIDLEWSDAELEKVAERIGYGPKPPELLKRSPEGGLLFVPQTVRDHIATKFIPLAPHSGDRSLELVLDVKTPGGQACEAWIQDQAFNTLATVPCRTAGEQKATTKTLADSVSSVRVYFQSPKREQVQLPARVKLVEHQ